MSAVLALQPDMAAHMLDEIATPADQYNFNASNTNTDADTSNASDAKKGILVADAVLASHVSSPTGAQMINTLQVTEGDLGVFEDIRKIAFGPLHIKLASFVPQVQSTWGIKNFYTSPASSFPTSPGGPANLCGFLDPVAFGEFTPHAETLLDLSDEQIQSCFHPLADVDGYPTIEGMPAWERNPWERMDYYNLFKLYRDMRYAFYDEVEFLLTNRSLKVLSRITRVPLPKMHHLAQIFHWNLRVSLYDLWMERQRQLRQATKKRLMLSRHEKLSQALITKAFRALERNIDKMAPKDAISLLELGLQFERISQGLLGDKPEGYGIKTSGAGANAGSEYSGGIAPLISVVNQTNNATGPLQVNNGGSVAQRALEDNMKHPDTLTSILGVLQRSGALDSVLSGAAAKESANSANSVSSDDTDGADNADNVNTIEEE